jgi:hypothetical protein
LGEKGKDGEPTILQKGLAASGRAHFQLDVLTLDQTRRPQRATEPLQERGSGVAADEDANGRQLRLRLRH